MTTPTSAFAAIQAALLASLAASPALAGGRISANKTRPIPTGQATAIVLRLDQSEGSEVLLGRIDWRTSFSVECYARGTASGDDSVLLVDALLRAVWSRLSTLSMDALNADLTITPQIDWQYDDAETPLVCAILRVAVTHRTAVTTLD